MLNRKQFNRKQPWYDDHPFDHPFDHPLDHQPDLDKDYHELLKIMELMKQTPLPSMTPPRDPAEVVVELEDKIKAMSERQEELELEVSELEERLVRLERQSE